MYPISSAPFYMAFNKEMAVDAGVAEKIKDGWTTIFSGPDVKSMVSNLTLILGFLS